MGNGRALSLFDEEEENAVPEIKVNKEFAARFEARCVGRDVMPLLRGLRASSRPDGVSHT